MNILYGVSGDGYGHSSRALVIGDFLRKQGHTVKIVTYGRAYKVLKGKFDVFRVSGMFLFYIRGILNKKKTFDTNAKNMAKNVYKWRRFYKLMKEFKPNLCITDFEPIVSFLAFWHRIPLLSIDNQHRITHLDVEVPKKYYKEYLLTRAVVNSLVPIANHFIIVSFSKPRIKNKNATAVTPIIRPEVKSLKPKFGDKVLVYLTRKDSCILEILKGLNEKFLVYGYNENKVKGNITFKKKESFLADLENCRCVIGNSGFTLISEAIYLKKPYFAIPLNGQFEQILNALFLKKSGFGDYADKPEEKDFVYFLYNLKKYMENLKKYNFDSENLFTVLKKEVAKFWRK